MRAERRRSNQLEKELRKARAQLSRFSEINPDEYARLQDAERKREEFERQVGDRERPELYLDPATRAPRVLYTGTLTPGGSGWGMSWTMAARVRA